MFAHSHDPVVAALSQARESLLSEGDYAVDDPTRIARIRAAEELKGAVAARQARDTSSFVISQRAEQARRGLSADRIGRGIAAQVGLARRISPYEARRYVGQASILTAELPQTLARLAAGEVPEHRVLIVARDSAWLTREDRAIVDASIAPQLERLGNRRTADMVRKLAFELDPQGSLERRKVAERERNVSVRSVGDGMARLSTLTTTGQAVAAYAALKTSADLRPGVVGDERSQSNVMADTLIERVTGQAKAAEVPVTVNLVMTDRTLIGEGEGADESAEVIGGGTIPAELARRMVLDPSGESGVFVRRLYTDSAGRLAALESQSRLFTPNQRQFLVFRDLVCRTPWCEAPIRHADHVVPAEDGGSTGTDNGQGLCEACNHAKQAPGWQQRVEGDEIVTRTPTGHEYRSRPPAPPQVRAVAASLALSPTNESANALRTRAITRGRSIKWRRAPAANSP